MDSETILTMLHYNIEIPPENTLMDEYLEALIEAAQAEIAREGITLAEGDENLVVMYAAYLYRKRAEDSPSMPRMLRYALNNRVFAEKVGE